MHIAELFDPAALEAALATGLVRAQRHPTLPMRILNYTESAVFAREWTPVTRACRGLVVADDGTVVARPWPKFFNHGEHAEGALDLVAPVEVTDKADGSLGILYPVPGGHAVATRGSFTSDQAVHGTALLRARHAGRWAPRPGWTYLFEIVYPENRIVVDYRGLDELVLLGAVETGSGAPCGPHDAPCDGWPGPRIAVLAADTLAGALAAAPRPDAEGLVARFLAGPLAGALVKVKQADYVALHRLIFGLTARRLWERAAVHACATDGLDLRRTAHALRLDPADVAGILDAGADWLHAVRAGAPEEFGDWIDATVAGLHADVAAVLAQVSTTAAPLSGRARRDAADAIADHPHRGLVFAALDGKPLLPMAWAAVRPAAERPFRYRTEDVA